MNTSLVPELDGELRRRLGRRFGTPVEAWLDGLPPVLARLAERWHLILESVIQRGTVSVVIRCRTADARPAVLKISPDRTRMVDEATALALWSTVHVPSVLAFDEGHGALLIEGIEPGTPLDVSEAYPSPGTLGQLMQSLHRAAPSRSRYPPLTERITNLYESGKKNYERRPDLADLIPLELYERGRELAMQLVANTHRTVVVHGDLTPSNVLDGGKDRGLVAIDPAPYVGDPAFDSIDLLLWRADDSETLTARAVQAAPFLGADPRRLLDWCAAFAAMNALEVAEATFERSQRVRFLVALAKAEA